MLAAHPEARRHVGMTFPAPNIRNPWPTGRPTTAAGRYAWPGEIAGSPTPPQTGLAELVNELHYSLGLPVAAST